MSIRIYNTATRKKEEFTPLHGTQVNFYCCGPTVYDYFHIGNARPLIMFDVFRRYLEYRGYTVNYIVNITDIDDKIINRAIQEGTDYRTIAEEYSEAFFDGMEKLGVRPATVHPYATEHISDMIALVSALVEGGHAYIVDGDVYFDITSFPPYGKLSGRDVEQLQAGARVDVDDRKRNPLDFALWKASKPGEPSWESPWGTGRPGWHIECSAMSMRYAEGTLDIHAGGQDLVFPHHENETAQSEAATGKPFARYWMHNGFLDIEGAKMSKSLGNFLTVREILKKYDSMAIRTFFLLKHYRSPIDFSEERIQEAHTAFLRLKHAHEKIERMLGRDITHQSGDTSLEIAAIEENKKQIEEALDDDFNTARAMGYLFDITRIVNNIDEKNEQAPVILRTAKDVFDDIGTGVFGLDFTSPAETSGLADSLITLLVEIRENARASKDFALADTIRDRLDGLGIKLEDRPEGTTWRIE
ncbi:cysteine--tRNA ligase [Candidatus Latescibacterota bacterium]